MTMRFRSLVGWRARLALDGKKAQKRLGKVSAFTIET